MKNERQLKILSIISSRAIHTQEELNDALVAEGLFPATLIGASRAERERPEEALRYIEEEFLNQGIPLSPSHARRIARFQEQAEDLALDLLAQGGA